MLVIYRYLNGKQMLKVLQTQLLEELETSCKNWHYVINIFVLKAMYICLVFLTTDPSQCFVCKWKC